MEASHRCGYASAAGGRRRVFVTDRTLAAGPSSRLTLSPATRLTARKASPVSDDNTVKVLWRHEYACPYELSYASGPRCTPVVRWPRLHLGAMGDLIAWKPIREKWSGR